MQEKRLSKFVALLVIAAGQLWVEAPSLAQGAATSEQFLAHYTAVNLGNSGSGQAAGRNYAFADSADSMNTFNRALRLAIPIGKRYPLSGDFSYRLTLRYGSNHWRWQDGGGSVAATPREQGWAAGLGWSLGFGTLFSPSENDFGYWTYEAADGRLVRFYDNHSGEAPTAGVYYSHDGSNLRLLVAGDEATVQWTDGTQRRYEQVAGAWRLQEIFDTYGNSVWITHDQVAGTIELADQHGRTQRVVFRSDPAGAFSRLVDRVELSGVGNTTAVYNFSYATLQLTSPAEDNDPQTPASHAVSVLTAVSYPAGRGYALTYHPGATVGGGRLATFTNRLGGTVAYEYEEILLPLAPDLANPSGATIDHFASDGVGLSRRTTRDFDGSTLGTWTLRATFSSARTAPPSTAQPHTLTTTVEGPEGYRKDFLHRAATFDVWIQSDKYAHRSEYAFPQGGKKPWETLRRTINLADGAVVDYALGRQILECTDCLDARTTWTHRRHYTTATPDSPQQWTQKRPLQVDWAGRGLDVRERDILGLQPDRTILRTGGGSLPAPTDPWIAQPFKSVKISEAGAQSVEVQRCGDAQGRVVRERQLRGSGPGGSDFLTTTQYDAAGNPVVKAYYGGDAQSLATSGDLCNLALPAAPQYRAFFEWSHGSRSAAGYLDSGGGILAEDFRATVDPQTGLTVARSEGDGLMRTIEYDAASRVSKRTIPGGGTAIQTVVYSDATATTPYAVTRTLRDAVGVVYSESKVERDGFGRKISESRRGPGGWATERWSHDALGRLVSHTAADGGVTQYLDLDHRGRPATIRPPEGAAHDRHLRHSGNHLSVATVSIAKNPASAQEITRTTTSKYDREGRLVHQTMSDSDGETSVKEYTYDLHGRWLTRSWNGAVETNLSTYDAAGLRVSGGRGGAFRYDALRRRANSYSKYGHEVLIGRDGAGRRASLTHNGQLYASFEYGTTNAGNDYRAGKLVKARRYNRNVPDVDGGVIVVQDEYAYTGMAGRVSHRLTTLEDVGGAPILTFESSATYDVAGDVVTFESPSCSGSSFYSCSQQSRTYAYAYDLGHLLSVTEQTSSVPRVWIEALQYDAQNRVTDYRSGNGLATELLYAPTTSGVDRVMVRSAQGALVWDSGSASQDGEGETTSYGAEQWMPGDFYQHRGFIPQPTSFEIPPATSEERVDPFGNDVSRLVACSPYPPCQDISVYNSDGDRVWYRQRPFSWPSSPVGMETPSILEFPDLLGRQGSSNEGFSGYYNDRYNYTITLTASYGSNFARREYIHGQEALIGRDFYLVNPEVEYLHSSFGGRIFGRSGSDGSFTPSGETQ